MQLKKVTVSFEYVIVVNEQVRATRVAREFAVDAMQDMSFNDLDIMIEDYEPGKVQGWDGECIPYGGDGNTRTNEYLKKIE